MGGTTLYIFSITFHPIITILSPLALLLPCVEGLFLLHNVLTLPHWRFIRKINERISTTHVEELCSPARYFPKQHNKIYLPFNQFPIHHFVSGLVFYLLSNH